MIAQCTGFLVSDNIVATNSHCIPYQLKSNSTLNCSKYLGIKFKPTNSNSKNIFTCKRLLSYSSIDVFEQDFAFFEIESTKRKAFELFKEGLEDNEEIKIIKITPLSGSQIGGVIETEICNITANSLLNPTAISPWSKTSLSVGCNGVSGNSGSPILNVNNEVIGILQSKMNDKYMTIYKKLFQHYNQDLLYKQLPPHIIFTNLTCTFDPITNTYPKEKCEAAEKLKFTDCLSLNTLENREKEKLALSNWESELPEIFIYETITDLKSDIIVAITAQPICVKNKNQMDERLWDEYVSHNGAFDPRTNTIELTYPLSVQISAQPVFNEYYILSEVVTKEVNRFNYKIEIKKNKNSWKGTLNPISNSKLFDLIDFTRVKIPINIPVCSKKQIQQGNISKVKTKKGDLLTQEEFDESYTKPMQADRSLCM